MDRGVLLMNVHTSECRGWYQKDKMLDSLNSEVIDYCVAVVLMFVSD